MKDIRGIILDVDGVIIGEKIGFNSPNPHIDVINKLKEIRNKGIPISLCTAKPHFSIGNIIKEAGLNNYHIADGGSVIINPINNEIVKKHIINKKIAKEILKIYIDNNVYTEFYTVDNYFIQKDQESKITKQHIHILQNNPLMLDNIAEESMKYEITKIMPIAFDEQDQIRVEKLFKEMNTGLTLSWGIHPVANPLKFGIITSAGISKKQGAIEISNNINVPLENILAVGDSTSDWQFIDLCGYGAAMGNGSEKLKELVKTKEKNRFCIGGDVDKNGILQIFDYFKEQL
ncbi:MAG: HAD-IIB family hydrolase [Clostridia bacterium]|nr:HAD-IIB family hydrolase [Clostridia bacterium]